ncbi:MAG: hypothetical protein CBB76_05160 [Crocinitomicaceae bacterium TMED16]|nr:MAG: hypothetical protein CBB76_07425 [Crocinitomicaceae bacterium TMED16]OUT70861.1 MAG: hypothetical protein CBB76_05160 [Crocinitomicaceae bacterium TMED16]|tara:strand:+ start:457 stop:939 length:483 start_codon:yes stop_codon:yes gene_type:complete
MKTILFASTLIFLLISCKQVVFLKAQLHHSHCGGAPPTSETRKGYHTEHEMDVTIIGDNDSIHMHVYGNDEVKLRPGNYRWYRGTKLVETKDFIEELQISLDSNFVLQGGAACIDEWKQKPDGEFSVSSNTDTIALTLKYRCYTGILPFPCVKYLGPIYQ